MYDGVVCIIWLGVTWNIKFLVEKGVREQDNVRIKKLTNVDYYYFVQERLFCTSQKDFFVQENFDYCYFMVDYILQKL